MSEEVDDSAFCPVCFECYSESGDAVPRLLPCSHTVCSACVDKLIKNSTLVCPQDRKSHPAISGVTRFPQNKYVLKMLKLNKTTSAPSGGLQWGTCEEHSMEVMLYCKHPDCQIGICPLCLSQHHRGHTVVNIDEPRMNVLKCKAAAIKQRLSLNVSRLVATRQKIDRQCLAMTEKIRLTRNELTKKFDEKIRAIDDNVRKLNEISLHKINDVGENDFKKKSKFIEQLQKQSEDVESMKYMFYNDLEETTQELEAPKEMAETSRIKRNEPTITVESNMTLNGSLDDVTGCLVLSDGSLLIYGSRRYYRNNKMLCNWKKEELIYSKDMDIKGAIEIRKGGDPFLLVSDGTTRLKFLEISNLAKCCESINVGNNVAKLYLDPPDHVLFETTNYVFLEYAKIDALSRARRFSLRLPEDRKDMCFTKDKDTEDPSMRFFFACTEEVSAYDQRGGFLWSFSGAPVGMAKDIQPTSITVNKEEQKLYVCDSANICIQVISTDGVYQGSLVEYDEYGLGIPKLLKWCTDTDSLLIVHRKAHNNHVCILKVMNEK